METLTLLFCAFLLCALQQEAAASKRVRCVGGACYFQLLENFQGAEKECKSRDGKMLPYNLTEDISSLLAGESGRVWLERVSTVNSSCQVLSASDAARQLEPCQNKVEGFLCQFSSNAVCVGLRTNAQVVYHLTEGFDVEDGDSFPPGTIATVGQPGVEHPDSKHLCFFSSWKAAPWSCEVFGGGCVHGCASKSCTCPLTHSLHPNNISCVASACADCAQKCHRQAGGHTCACEAGFRLAANGKDCVVVDECKERNPCTGEGESCMNTQGSYVCVCAEGFVEEDGQCVNVSICEHCEHMLCPKVKGVYQCACRNGFRVSPADPTRCEQHCAERDCEATCIKDPALQAKEMQQCFCPQGYITDTRNNTVFCTDINECEQQRMCEHKCVNLFGSYKCVCDEGFQLRDSADCIPLDVDYNDLGSGSSSPPLKMENSLAEQQTAALPFYIRAGSILGISVFTALCVILLLCLVRNMSKRCGSFEVPSLKHPDIDIFYLQQVTVETYKRLSFDMDSKRDSQRFTETYT